MAYTKTNWQDLPNTTTPINATNLNKIENELEALDTKTTGINYNNSTTIIDGDINLKRVEIFPSTGINTPYIDFHYGNSTSDYTSRIIEESSGVLGMRNGLIVDGNLVARKSIRGFDSTNEVQPNHTYSITINAANMNFGNSLGAILIAVGGWVVSTSSQTSLFLLSWSGGTMEYSALNPIIQGHGTCEITSRTQNSLTLNIVGSSYNMISLF